MTPRAGHRIIIWILLAALPRVLVAQSDTTYKIVDTRQTLCYNNSGIVSAPSLGASFYGQDAQYNGNQPSYKDNGDGTITDVVTDLMWQKTADRNGDGVFNISDKLYASEAYDSAATCRTGGYTDWRLPSIKELYSLIQFSGAEISPNATSTADVTPFLDTTYFKTGFGDLSSGERLIDAQYATSTIYGSRTYVGSSTGDSTFFGVNFVDGRIKGYPLSPYSTSKNYYVRYVRGNSEYGKNRYVDNGNGTITDSATGLMWVKADNGSGVLWEDALSYAEGFTYAGYSDWRLPNAKELHSILDYSRSPDITNSPAISPLFSCTQITNEAGNADYPCYWTSTTFSSETPSDGRAAVYVSFGRAMGYIAASGGWVDVHGAGAQRSDPKSGDPSQYPYGHGPQGDAIRIYNYVRLVRGGNITTDVHQSGSTIVPDKSTLQQNYPNPFNSTTIITYQLPKSSYVTIDLFDVLGREISVLVDGLKDAGFHELSLDASRLGSGVYFCRLQAVSFIETRKLVLLR
jgi:hypothetical protein